MHSIYPMPIAYIVHIPCFFLAWNPCAWALEVSEDILAGYAWRAFQLLFLDSGGQQCFPKSNACPADAGKHRADRHTQHLGSLLVGQFAHHH